LRVVIVERSPAFDRKVGESAIELSSWFLLHVLGLDRHLALEHLPKYGLRFWFTNEKVSTLADASELGNLYQTRVPSFHIDRSVLDEHVLSLARDEGARVLRPARAVDVGINEGGDSTVRIESASGDGTLRARWVIDATGRKAWLARRMGLLTPLTEHPTRSIWARYTGTRDFDGGWQAKGATRPAVASRGLSTNHLTGPGWWVWVIPLPGGETSIGVVWDERLFELPPGDTVARRFDAFLRSFPAGRELIEGATRLDDDLHALNGLAYSVSPIMGDGWAMVGDAAGFIDPFYSPGLDWAALTTTGTARVVAASLAPGAARADTVAAVARHNAVHTTGFRRWFEALYRDKYFYLGDAELMGVALRLEVALYYFGVVTPPYRDGVKGLSPLFSEPIAYPFYRLMRFVNRRLAGLGRARLASGRWGRKNAGRRVLLPGFKLGYGNLRSVPGGLARLALLEIGSLGDRLASRRRRPAALTPSVDSIHRQETR